MPAAHRAGRQSRDLSWSAVKPRISTWTGIAAALLVFALALRIWVLASPLGRLDADEAVLGLMARHALEGEFSVFFWLQAYTGTQTSLLTAAVFSMFGSSDVALKLVELALYVVAAFLVWRVGIRTVREPAARLAAGLFLAWPPFFVFWTTKAYGYAQAMVCGLIVLLLALRLHERSSDRDLVLLGFALGLGWWASPQIVTLSLPALVWLTVRRPRLWRRAWVAIPPLLFGASPWLAWNVKHDWLSLHVGEAAGAGSTFVSRLGDLFRFVLPTWVGVRTPFTLEWTIGRTVGMAILAVLAGGLVVLVVRRPRPLEPLLFVAAAFPILFAISPFAAYAVQPRYVVAAAPVPALLIAYGLVRSPPAAAVALIAAAAITIGGLRALDEVGPQAASPTVRTDVRPLIDVLEREGATRVLADYWLAYRISFESGERVIATPTGFVRYEPHDRLVRNSPKPAYVFVRPSAAERRSRASLEADGYRRLLLPDFAVFVHG
jgi:4-amino-4-deoxy-L-arabinose transferase-like glycosyltransferase